MVRKSLGIDNNAKVCTSWKAVNEAYRRSSRLPAPWRWPHGARCDNKRHALNPLNRLLGPDKLPLEVLLLIFDVLFQKLDVSARLQERSGAAGDVKEDGADIEGECAGVCAADAVPLHDGSH